MTLSNRSLPLSVRTLTPRVTCDAENRCSEVERSGEPLGDGVDICRLPPTIGAPLRTVSEAEEAVVAQKVKEADGGERIEARGSADQTDAPMGTRWSSMKRGE